MVAPVIITADLSVQGLDGVTVNAGAGNASREVVAIGDPTDPLAYAPVSSTFASATSYALVTRLAAPPPNRTAFGVVSSVGNVVSTSADGCSMVNIGLSTASTNIVVFESSNNGGANWVSSVAFPTPATQPGRSTTGIFGYTHWTVPCYEGSDVVRVRCISTNAAGSTGVWMQGTLGSAIMQAVNLDSANFLATVNGTVTVQGTSNAITQPTANAAAANTGIFSSTATSAIILKSAAGNVYGVNALNGAIAAFLQLYNASTVPADSTVATPIREWAIPANGSFDQTFNPPLRVSTGAVLVLSSSGPFAKAGITGFLAGECA